MFGSTNNNPRRLRHEYFTAHIGLYPSFDAYLFWYQHSIQTLFKDVSEGNSTADLVALPLLYLMRHAIELGYKFGLQALCEINSSPFAPQAKGDEGHSLTKLHRRLRSELLTAVSQHRVSHKDEAEFTKYYSITEKTMKLFDNLDMGATKLRFPSTGKTTAFPRGKQINLLDVKDTFDKSMVFLDTIVDVIARPDRYYSVAVRTKGDKRVSKRRRIVVSKRRRAIKSGLLSDPLVWG